MIVEESVEESPLKLKLLDSGVSFSTPSGLQKENPTPQVKVMPLKKSSSMRRLRSRPSKL